MLHTGGGGFWCKRSTDLVPFLLQGDAATCSPAFNNFSGIGLLAFQPENSAEMLSSSFSQSWQLEHVRSM